MADFNRIAGSYDFLKRLVFGRQLEKASRCFLDQIPPNSKILLVGGGSGQLLECFKASQRVKYVELSEAMLNKAKKCKSAATVEFIQADILEWSTNEKFDLVITPFILDCFDENKLDLIFPNLRNSLKKEGRWIQTDFYPKGRGHKLFVKIMYCFFNLSINLETRKLADFDLFFEKYHFICKRNARFYHSMVESKIYQKID